MFYLIAMFVTFCTHEINWNKILVVWYFNRLLDRYRLDMVS